MRSAHLSDLHFGRRISQDKLKALREDLVAQAPDLLVITGDITDSGTIAQFRRAREFLRSLGIPFISVPGNREVGVFAVWEWLMPWLAMRRYSSFFGNIDRVAHSLEEVPVLFLGLNSVHAFPSWPGSISRGTRHWLKDQASRFPDYVKVLFLHHPVLPVIRSSSFWAHTLSEAGELLNICTQTGIHLILQGHKHRSSVMEIKFPERDARIVVSSCGAPLMSRWDPVYHMIDISPLSILVCPRGFSDGAFAETGFYEFPMDGMPADGPGPDNSGPSPTEP